MCDHCAAVILPTADFSGGWLSYSGSMESLMSYSFLTRRLVDTIHFYEYFDYMTFGSYIAYAAATLCECGSIARSVTQRHV